MKTIDELQFRERKNLSSIVNIKSIGCREFFLDWMDTEVKGTLKRKRKPANKHIQDYKLDANETRIIRTYAEDEEFNRYPFVINSETKELDETFVSKPPLKIILGHPSVTDAAVEVWFVANSRDEHVDHYLSNVTLSCFSNLGLVLSMGLAEFFKDARNDPTTNRVY
jgi:hypothetical protein